MRHRLGFSSLLLALFLALAPTVMASSTWYVDGVNGSDGNDCKSPQTACKTIGHAIVLASSGDAILVGPANYIENLTIGFSLRILAASAKTTIINGGATNTVITVSNSSAHVTLSELTILNGLASGFGGGIFNSGTLRINDSTITGNRTGGGLGHGGGGIANDGTLTINNSTLNHNSTQGPYGGGISNRGTLTINNSTISGNSAGFGGGIMNSGTVAMSNSTISGNSGDGINSFGTATLQNSIVAGNSGGNCGGTMTSNGYNLSSDGTCNFNNSGDLNNTDPKLGGLGNYGGPTQTIPLRRGSPAIDAGNPRGCTDGRGHLLKTDQRGAPRPDKGDSGGCDMGAFERQKD
jgi:hypothetical protein